MGSEQPVPGKCGSRLKRGGFCGQLAGYGTDHIGFGRCKYHTGSTRAGKLNAAKQRFEAERREWAAYGINHAIPIDPHDALLTEVHRTSGIIAWLEMKVGPSDESELIQSTDKGDFPSVWVSLLQAERAHLVRAAKTAIDCGVAERAVRVAEQQGEQLARAVQEILGSLQLTPEQEANAPGVVRSVFLAMAAREQQRAIEAGPAVEDAEMVG